jgi:hypothetical protein
LDSLEDFRKNPHVKFPLKSPCANFQSLGIFKNPIFIRKRILFRFRPIWPSLARAGPLCPIGRRVHAQPIRPEQPWRICQKVYFLRLYTFRQRRLLSLMSLSCGPRPSASSPSPRRPISVTSPPLLTASGHPAPPGLRHRDANRSLYFPALIPPFNPPLNPSLSHLIFNGVKAITAGRFPLPRPGPYKRRAPPSGFTGPLPASLLFSLCPSTTRIERLLRWLFPTDARLFPSLRCPLLQPMRITAVPSPLFLNHCEAPLTGAPFRPSSGVPPLRPCPRSTVDWCRSWSTELWTGSMTISIRK